MDNIFTPEEANQPVTYGDLALILGEMINNLSKESINYTNTLQENTFKLIDTITDHMVKIRNDASYERQRDIRFVLGYLASLWGCDNDRMYNNYKHWCEEFDKLNRPKTNSEDTNG